jgi:hypothetical protein
MGAVPYGRATADSADAAQVGRANVASGFRQTQKLQVAKSAKWSDISQPVADPGASYRSRPPAMAGRENFFTCSHIKQICSPGPHYIKFKLSQD